MEKLPLPLKDFKKIDVSLDQILNTTDYDVGYILQVDSEYLDALHDLQEDLRLAPTKEYIEKCFLSDYQQKLLERMRFKKTKQPKWFQTLNSKTI